MTYIFLPAYNEDLALPRLVRKFDDEFQSDPSRYRLVVLDDGSSDRTCREGEELAKRYPLTLLRHEKNKGLGRTMIDGLEYIAQISSDDDTVVTLDCDDTHDPRYVHLAIGKLAQGYDCVILSRYAVGGGERGLSFVKSLLSRGAGLFLKFFFPISGVREYSCGYRVFRASVLKRAIRVFGSDFVSLPQMGFVVTPEILIKFRMLGCRVTEVPFVLHYDRKPTASKSRPLKTITGYWLLVWRFWGR